MTTRFKTGLLAATLVMATASTSLAGPEWDEVPDAGSLPSSAQVVPGDVKLIRGATTGLSFTGAPDFEDMYRITILHPTIFCARTVPLGELFDCCGQPLAPDYHVIQGTNFNTQMWLFDNAGLGLLGNDDESVSSNLSAFGNSDNDPPPVTVITTPGQYYIAISGGPGNDPVSGGGAIFFQNLVTEVSGPDGPGGGLPITQWTGGGPVGLYEIVLCGTVQIEGIPLVSPTTLALLAGTILVFGAVLIRRRLA